MTEVPRRRSASVDDDGTDADVLAAGALVWRLHRGKLQVLLIHRPRYDDWSFPKGKLDPGETLPECAVREVAEEIQLKVRLGVPLPITRYQVSKKSKQGPVTQQKEVWYWAAEVLEGRPRPDGDETDDALWAEPQQARQMLTNPGDLEPLDELERLHGQNSLRTVPFVVLRHAKAKPRSSWAKAEAERPLAATGKRQARSVERLLTAWRPRQIHSSPWKRCAETIAPYVKEHHHRIKYRKSLTEKRAKQNPGKAASRIRRSLEWMHPSLVCTHRPVLPIVLGELSRWLLDREIGRALPPEDPYLRPGGVVVAQQAVDRGGRIVSLEVYEPHED
ncbi:NUDIX hydrolase [Nesterenkonia salmonea]|uniref:NUDIX hydrolase n=1 Tax=Nesterenkonia salmonea TaxID=1804987 RepID=A0A5R9BA15_9MICC|nr:NUDIX hydrolase [Nesterenkonia salmonea]TLP94557.1 NUDIX hydrolase [Nesterenkonia salmonea]